MCVYILQKLNALLCLLHAALLKKVLKFLKKVCCLPLTLCSTPPTKSPTYDYTQKQSQ